MATMKNMVAMIPLELTEQTRKILVFSTCCQISLQTTSKDTFILDLSIIIDQPLHTLVLNIGKNLVVMSQTESKLNAAYGPVLRKDAQMTFTAETMMVNDMETWENTTRAPRIHVDVNTF